MLHTPKMLIRKQLCCRKLIPIQFQFCWCCGLVDCLVLRQHHAMTTRVPLTWGSSYLSLPHSEGIPGMHNSQLPFLFWWQQFYLISKACWSVYVYSSLHSNRTLGSCTVWTHHWRGAFSLCFSLLVLSLGCIGEPPLSVVTFKDVYLTARSCSSSNYSIIFN